MSKMTDKLVEVIKSSEEPNVIYKAMLAWLVDKLAEVEKLSIEIRGIADVCEDHARGLGQHAVAHDIMIIGSTARAITNVLREEDDDAPKC